MRRISTFRGLAMSISRRTGNSLIEFLTPMHRPGDENDKKRARRSAMRAAVTLREFFSWGGNYAYWSDGELLFCDRSTEYYLAQVLSRY